MESTASPRANKLKQKSFININESVEILQICLKFCKKLLNHKIKNIEYLKEDGIEDRKREG